MTPRSPSWRPAAFTLVELLVSMVVMTLLLLALTSVTNFTQKIWMNTTAKVSQFQDAREAYEAVTRKLGQATLNTYLDYDYPLDSTGAPDTKQSPKRYMRQSELRYINGQAKTLVTASFAANCPTHAVFFQAPIGYTTDTTHADLSRLLNTCGYFIQFGDDSGLRPSFITTARVPLRYRFRLMEMVESTETLTLYQYTNGKPNYNTTEWFNAPLAAAPAPTQVRADNVVALVIWPKLAPGEDASGVRLAPGYAYDSTATAADPAVNPKNQLPPVVQVTMVAVDETSFKRTQTTTTMPDLYGANLFTDPTKFAADLATFQATLQGKRFNYRVFTSNVSIKGAKWSRNQIN